MEFVSVCVCVCVFAAHGDQKRSVTFTETQPEISCKSPSETKETGYSSSPPRVAVKADLECPSFPQVHKPSCFI